MATASLTDREQRVASHAERIQRELKERRDFQSKPDAKAMTKTDVANVEPLDLDAEQAILQKFTERRAIKRPPVVETPSNFEMEVVELGVWDWPENDYRWTLTPHQVRRLANIDLNDARRLGGKKEMAKRFANED